MKARTKNWKSKSIEPEQITAVRAHCNRVNPTPPGGSRCSYPKCWHPTCKAEIEGGLREHARRAPVNVQA